MHAPPAPILTSTPGIAASQGALYSYQVSATDPAGGAVAFSLAVSPAGATLVGNQLNWTPDAAQSRVANSFTITATTSSGGTKTQSWTVTPTGTITVSVIDTFWTSTGPQTNPGGCALCAAVVPNADGSYTVIPGSNTAPGTVTIPNVPGGYYWLAVSHNLADDITAGFWTSSSTVDLGRDISGSLTAGTTSQNTIFDFNIGGLDPTSSPSLVAVSTPNFVMSADSDATTASGTTTIDGTEDWSKVDTVFLRQYEPASLGSLNFLTLGPALTLTNPGYIDGATNTIAETLQPSPQTSLDLSVPGSQWASLLNGNLGPSAAQVLGSWLSVTAEPFITGRNESPDTLAPNVALVTDPLPTVGLLGSPIDFCLDGALLGLPPIGESAILTDQDFGALNYGDPYPSSWTRAVEFCQAATVSFPVMGSSITSFPFPLPFGVAVPPSSSPSLAPLAEPVRNPTVNGGSLFTVSSVDTTAITLSWSAPAGAAPAGYRILLYTEISMPNSVALASAGTFGTAQTSVTLPPLMAGQTYIFIITTVADAATNMETSPYRSALPAGFASVISAPVTIDSGAMAPAVHGDAQAFQQLFRQKGKPFMTRFASGSR